jgi:hypothetical protein
MRGVRGVKGTIKSAAEISSLFKTARKTTAASFVALTEKKDSKCGSVGRVAFLAG